MTSSFSWRDRPTFVTGGTGLVGSWLVQSLLERQADVVCLVRDWVPHSHLVTGGLHSRVKIVRGDICDAELMERTVAEYDIDTVFHLAAQTIVGIANRNPVSTLATNIQGTWSVLEACRRNSTVKQIVVASSDKAYGAQNVLPYDEDSSMAGTHPYDVSKSCADLISRMYAKSFNLPLAVTRCGNFFGPGDLNFSRLVPGTIRSVLREEAPIIRSDGRFIRDYIYVEDGSAAYILLAEALGTRPELKGEAYNFSYELKLSVTDLVTRILKAMNSKLTPKILNQASNEIREQHLSATKARQELAWKPLFDMDVGLKRTISWYETLDRKGD